MLRRLKEEIKKNLGIELEQALANILKKRVLDQLVELNPIDIPDAMMDSEIKQLQQATLQQMAQQQGMKEVPKIELPRDSFVEQAKERVTLGLLLGEYIKQHDITVDDDKVRARIEDIASHYEGSREVVDWYYKNKQMLNEVQSYVLEQAAIDQLLENAVLLDKSLSFQEVVDLQNKKEQ